MCKAKSELWEAMKTYDNVMGSECAHGDEFHILWEDGMCCPKVCFECNGMSGDDAECALGGTNHDTTSGDAMVAAPGEGDSDETHSF